MINRWGVEIKKGLKVICHHPRGGTISGTIARIYTLQGYGKRIDLAEGGSVSIDDVIKVIK